MSALEQSNLNGVIGDPLFFVLLENDVREDMKSRYGFGIESVHRVTGEVPKELLRPATLPMSGKLVIARAPNADSLKRIQSACEKYPTLHVVLEWEDDSFDKRIKLLRELIEDQRIVKMLGFIQSSEKQRFARVCEMIAQLDGLDLSEEAVKALFEVVPRVKRSITVDRDGKKQKRDRLVINLTRVRSEAQKAQAEAGFGEKVLREHVLACVSRIEEPDSWALIDAITAGDTEETIRHLDNCVYDIGTANEVLGLIRSQLLMMVRVKNVYDAMSDPGLMVQDIIAKLSLYSTKFDVWQEEGTSVKPVQPPNWYRVNKIFSLRGSPIWDHCEEAVAVCRECYADLHGWLSTDWRAILTAFCLRLCSEDCVTLSLPDA